MEVISVITTVYTVTRAITDYLDQREEKNATTQQITGITKQIQTLLQPLLAPQNAKKVQPQLLGSIRNIGDVLTMTEEHLTLWKESRSSRLISFFDPSSVTKQLKDDAQLLNQHLVILIAAIAITDHLRNQELAPRVIDRDRHDAVGMHVDHSEVNDFWRRFIGTKIPSISNQTFIHRLSLWLGRSLDESSAMKILLWLDEAGTGNITLPHLQDVLEYRTLRESIDVYTRDPGLPLLLCISNNPLNHSRAINYALKLNVTVVQLPSTAYAIAWMRANDRFLRQNDHSSRIRCISDNVRVKNDPITGIPGINYGAGENLLRHIREQNYRFPVLIRADSSIQMTQYVLSYFMAGSTSRNEICEEYIHALASGRNDDSGWKKYMA
ncbi:hypothetical protein BDQ12DRAFT_683283 [Crucibulum laeve]|uniref:Uncharacterized protein n=1 Tax=Crucibulum laeve TaxID=68775 RepID=A0A5C3M1V5_9AGAR|nr:hypothetical protein BDQ12DRAFT_683283 [Crucibulum laeve]